MIKLNSDKTFTVLVTFSIMLSYIASEIYLPAMPVLKLFFHENAHDIQLGISIFILGVAFSQLFGGPIIDRFSYRFLGVIMCFFFALSSLCCALSNQLFTLLIFRFIQAISVGVIALIGRACLARRFSSQEVVKKYLIISPALSLSLSFSPFIGGYLTEYFGWNYIFYFLIILSVFLLFLFCFIRFDTVKKPDAISLHPVSILKTYRSLFKNKAYIAAFFALSSVFSQYIAYLTETPFIFSKLAYSSKEIGRSYVYISIACVLGSLIVRKLFKIISYEKIVSLGFFINFMGVILMVLFVLTKGKGAFDVIFPGILLGLGNGIIIPVITGKAISIFPEKSGYASGLLSSISLLFSAVSAGVVGRLTNGSLLYLSVYLFVLITIGFSCFYLFSVKE